MLVRGRAQSVGSMALPVPAAEGEWGETVGAGKVEGMLVRGRAQLVGSMALPVPTAEDEWGETVGASKVEGVLVRGRAQSVGSVVLPMPATAGVQMGLPITALSLTGSRALHTLAARGENEVITQRHGTHQTGRRRG